MQKLKFVIKDCDEISEDDIIGEFETNVGAIMGANGQTLSS